MYGEPGDPSVPIDKEGPCFADTKGMDGGMGWDGIGGGGGEGRFVLPSRARFKLLLTSLTRPSVRSIVSFQV